MPIKPDQTSNLVVVAVVLDFHKMVVMVVPVEVVEVVPEPTQLHLVALVD